MKDKRNKWIMMRDGEVRQIFNNREEAVAHFKELLKQTLRDFDNQDTHSEYDYSFTIPKTEFRQVIPRESFLSLI